jgi:hypothetical protein
MADTRDAALLSLLFQMESAQWLSAEGLREQQERQPGALLDHARRHCRFYRDHLWRRRDLSAAMAIIRQFPEPVDSTKPGQWGGVLRSGPAWRLPISVIPPYLGVVRSRAGYKS